MQVVEEIMIGLKMIEGREDTPALVLREELLEELEEYINSKKKVKFEIIEGIIVSRIEK